jgi:hypothetical protein
MHGVQWKQEPAVIALASLVVLRTSTLRLDFPFARHHLALLFRGAAVELVRTGADSGRAGLLGLRKQGGLPGSGPAGQVQAPRCDPVALVCAVTR